MADHWELALIAVIERELAQLAWLIECVRSGEEDTPRSDVHAQINRLSGLTDLSGEGYSGRFGPTLLPSLLSK